MNKNISKALHVSEQVKNNTPVLIISKLPGRHEIEEFFAQRTLLKKKSFSFIEKKCNPYIAWETPNWKVS